MNDDKLVRNILILVGVAFLLFLVVLYTVYRNLPSILGSLMGAPDVPELKLPESLNRPRVVTGEHVFLKTVFLEDSTLDHFTDIRWGDFVGDPQPELVVLSSRAALFLDAQGHFKTGNRIDFQSESTDRVVLVDLEYDRTPEFLSRGSWAHDVTLFGHDGSVRWIYGSGLPGVDDSAAGDVDGDGLAEIVVGFNGDGGVHLLDATGKKLWRQPDGNVWHVEIIDIDGDGRGEIVHSSVEFGGDFVVRDRHGKVLLRRDAPVHLGSWSPTRWGEESEPSHIATADTEFIWVLDLKGEEVARFHAPDCHHVADVYATPLRHPSGATYFAALTDYSPPWGRSALYVYGPARQLLYQEVLDGSCGSVAAVAFDSQESLLVGCDGKIWQYSWKAASAN